MILNLKVVIAQAVSRQLFTGEAWVLWPHKIGVWESGTGTSFQVFLYIFQCSPKTCHSKIKEYRAIKITTLSLVVISAKSFKTQMIIFMLLTCISQKVRGVKHMKANTSLMSVSCNLSYKTLIQSWINNHNQNIQTQSTFPCHLKSTMTEHHEKPKLLCN